MDLWQMDVRRFGAQYRSPSYTLKRVLETYETYYDIHYPFEERQAGRPLRTSPAYEWHRSRDAAFGEKSGWERVNWYESNAGAATSRCARAAGPGQAGRPRSGRAPGLPGGGGDLRRVLVREAGGGRAGRGRCSSGCATTAWRARSGA